MPSQNAIFLRFLRYLLRSRAAFVTKTTPSLAVRSPYAAVYIRFVKIVAHSSTAALCPQNGLFGPDALAHVYRALLYYGKSFTGSPAAMLVTRKALRLYSIAQ